MSGSLRYRNPDIVEHLANQYVAGVMSPLVRQRMEVLLLNTPELDRAVSFWSDQFSAIHQALPEEQPSVKVWDAIEENIETTAIQSGSLRNQQGTSWWDSLSFWRTAGFAGLAASGLLALLLFNKPLAPPVIQTVAVEQPSPKVEVKLGIDYMAAMVAKGDADNTIKFVISAYKKQVDKPSRLVVQWSKRHERVVPKGMHLWAENKDTGVLSYIGIEPPEKGAWNLNKETWKAISNSSRLMMTSNEKSPDESNLLFAGQCVQLGAWKKA